MSSTSPPPNTRRTENLECLDSEEDGQRAPSPSQPAPRQRPVAPAPRMASPQTFRLDGGDDSTSASSSFGDDTTARPSVVANPARSPGANGGNFKVRNLINFSECEAEAAQLGENQPECEPDSQPRTTRWPSATGRNYFVLLF